MIICVGTEKVGRLVKKYNLRNTETGNEIWVNKDEMLQHIENNEIANAKIQWWQGSPIIRIKEDINKIVSSEVKTQEVSEKSKEVINEKVVFGKEAVEELKKAEKGTPVIIRLNGNYKQTILMGRTVTENGKDGTAFFDDNGINGYFIFSDMFIENKDKEFLQFIIGKGIPEDTARLLDKIRKYQNTQG